MLQEINKIQNGALWYSAFVLNGNWSFCKAYICILCGKCTGLGICITNAPKIKYCSVILLSNESLCKVYLKLETRAEMQLGPQCLGVDVCVEG
jgi:hypothetical protein